MIEKKWYIRCGNPSFPDGFAWVMSIEIYSNPASDWIFGVSIGHPRVFRDPIWFCEKKAKRIARILNTQYDEEGGGGVYVAVCTKPKEIK